MLHEQVKASMYSLYLLKLLYEYSNYYMLSFIKCWNNKYKWTKSCCNWIGYILFLIYSPNAIWNQHNISDGMSGHTTYFEKLA